MFTFICVLFCFNLANTLAWHARWFCLSFWYATFLVCFVESAMINQRDTTTRIDRKNRICFFILALSSSFFHSRVYWFWALSPFWLVASAIGRCVSTWKTYLILKAKRSYRCFKANFKTICWKDLWSRLMKPMFSYLKNVKLADILNRCHQNRSLFEVLQLSFDQKIKVYKNSESTYLKLSDIVLFKEVWANIL